MQEKQGSTGLKVSNQSEESMFCSQAANKKMADMLSYFCVPFWAYMEDSLNERKCCECSNPLGVHSIRGIGICLNAQHFGDIQVEVLCKSCSASYFMHFRKACATATEFGYSIFGMRPKTKPVLRHNIKPTENNLTDAIILDHIKEHPEASVSDPEENIEVESNSSNCVDSGQVEEKSCQS